MNSCRCPVDQSSGGNNVLMRIPVSSSMRMFLRKVRNYYNCELKFRILPRITEARFKIILTDVLNINSGDVVFVHSSAQELHLEFPFYRCIDCLREVVGEQGTLLFPAYPELPSYDFLLSGKVFDARKSPAYTGIISEAARRQKDAFRSLHPTKSVCAIGRYAKDLTDAHSQSPYPYDAESPYYRIVRYGGKVIGLGTTTQSLSFVHCVEDLLKDKFPIQVYHPRLFDAPCINASGKAEIVQTYAHDMSRVYRSGLEVDVPGYMRKYISKDICEDIMVYGRPFFKVDARKLLGEMEHLTQQNIMIYADKQNNYGRFG